MQVQQSGISDMQQNYNFLKVSMVDKDNFQMMSPGFRISHDSQPMEKDKPSSMKNHSNHREEEFNDKSHQS